MTALLPDSVMQFCKAPHQFLLDMAISGPAAQFRMNDETFMVLSDPTSIHAVMNGKLEDFEKGALTEIPRVFWRDGILSVEGDEWIEQHSMFAPLFARRRIRRLEPLIAGLVTRLMETWAALPPGEPLDILAAANRLAFEVVSIGLLGIGDTPLSQGLFDTLGEVDSPETVRLNYLIKSFGKEVRGGFSPSAHSESLKRLNSLAKAAAEERLARDTPGDDVMSDLIATEAFQSFDRERQLSFISDQIATLLSAGYVTTGESIFWAFYMLAKHPVAQSRARAEILAETDAGAGGVPIDAPPFLTAAFNESQRLYPPVWLVGRVARRAVRVGDIDIPAGTRVICSPYVLHRMPSLWSDSDQYRPERFLPDADPPVTPRTLIPFGTGMRACIGRGLALMEMSAVACATLARFELEAIGDAPIVLPATYSVHPREPILFRLKGLA
ncbi:cytochrome P450 [Labrys miyagiensis]